MRLSDLAGKRLAVLGAGREGLSTTRYLVRHGLKPTLADEAPDPLPTDDRATLQKAGVEFRFGPDCLDKLTDFEILFRTPGLPWLHPKLAAARKAGVTVTSQTRLFFAECPAPIVGITGTKGKGTTAMLLSEALKRAGTAVHLGGNIGQPPLDFLDDLSKIDTVVLELSSYQLQDLDVSPRLAVVTNLGIDHLDHHADAKEYHDAKANIVRHQTSDDTAILNADDPGSAGLVKQAGGSVVWYGDQKKKTPGAYLENGQVVVELAGEAPVLVCSSEEIRIPGRHNLHNVLAVAATALHLGAAPKNVRDTVKDFRGLPYHLELVGEKNGVRYFNDSYATNPTATIPAIESFNSPVVLIVGGSEKGLDFTELAKTIVRSSVQTVLVIPPEGERIAEAVRVQAERDRERPPDFVGIDTKEAIVPTAARLAQPGGVVLFSPAAASFGMFPNYQERGRYFSEQVGAL